MVHFLLQVSLPVTTTPSSNVQLYLQFASTSLTAILAFLLTLFGLRQAAANKKQNVSNERQEKNIVEIRTFTNSALGASLKVAAAALRRVADNTKLPEDIALAHSAELAAAAHEAAQKVVDAAQAALPVSQQS